MKCELLILASVVAVVLAASPAMAQEEHVGKVIVLADPVEEPEPVGAPSVAVGAEPDVVVTVPAKKVGFLGRFANGVKNVILAPIDIPFTIVRHTEDSGDPVISTVSGTAEGVVNCGVRAFAGVLEIVTSPVPGKRYPLYERQPGERSIRQKPSF